MIVVRQGLCQVVLPGMIVLLNTMEMGIWSLRKTREQGNGRGNCAEPTHWKPLYKSGTGQPNHFEVPPDLTAQSGKWECDSILSVPG